MSIWCGFGTAKLRSRSAVSRAVIVGDGPGGVDVTSAPSGLGRLAPEVPEAPPFALLEPSKAAIYRRGAAALAAISLGIALTVLVGGWTLGARTLRSFGPGYAEMFANAAIAVALISTTVMIHALGRPRPGWRGLARGLNLLACTIALATLLEWVAGASLGIDDLLFTASSSGFRTSHPGRIPPNTVVVLLLLSGAVELTLAARRATLRQWLGIGAATVSLVAFLGYATQTTKLYGIASGARMALPTSLALGALSIALLASQPTSGLMAYL